MPTDTHSLRLGNFAVTTPDYAAFRAKVALVPIIRSGNLATTYWTVQDNYESPDALGALHSFLKRVLAHSLSTSKEVLTADQEHAIITDSIAGLLSSSVVIDPMLYFIGPDDHSLILYRADSEVLGASPRETIIAITWNLEKEAGH